LQLYIFIFNSLFELSDRCIFLGNYLLFKVDNIDFIIYKLLILGLFEYNFLL